MAKSEVLVTGGAGFIGSNIVAELVSSGYEVTVCDRLREASSGKWRNLAKHPISNLIAPEELDAWLAASRPRLVVHMGAISSTLETDADKIFHNNFRLSRRLWAWCAGNGARLIYASSAATYGDGTLGFDDSQELDALQALRPLNAYGWSKALFDIFAVREAAAGRAPPLWVGLKLFNVYGPNEGHKGAMRSVISKIWPTIASGGVVQLFKSHRPDVADGGQMRDFVYVRDVADAVSWLADHGPANGVYNLGTGTARSFADLARAAFAAAGQTPRIDYIPMPDTLTGAYQYFTQARMDRLRDIGWTTPATSLESGVADYVNTYLSQTDPHR